MHPHPFRNSSRMLHISVKALTMRTSLRFLALTPDCAGHDKYGRISRAVVSDWPIAGGEDSRGRTRATCQRRTADLGGAPQVLKLYGRHAGCDSLGSTMRLDIFSCVPDTVSISAHHVSARHVAHCGVNRRILTLTRRDRSPARRRYSPWRYGHAPVATVGGIVGHP
jgi:hypothetical protein